MKVCGDFRWDKARQALAHAQYIAEHYSKDPRTKVGALILAPDWTPISWGYNGFPKGTLEMPELWADREAKYKRVRHAEANALDFARGDTRGAAIFCTLFPCSQCAGQIIQKGISAVFYGGEPRMDLGAAEALAMFADAGVEVYKLPVATLVR